MTVTSGLLLVLGEGDCERIVDGVTGQTANTLSSVAFVLAGAWLVAHVRREGGWRWATLGLATIAAGLGSIAYHGPMPAAGQFLHDIGLVSMPLTVGAIELGTRRSGVPTMLRVMLPSLALAGTVLAVRPSLTLPVTAVAAVWAGLGVLLAWLRASRPVRRLRWRPLVVLVLATALGASSRHLGRTGGALCDPESLLQPHAAWHVLAALAVVAFAHAAYGVPVDRRARAVAR